MSVCLSILTIGYGYYRTRAPLLRPACVILFIECTTIRARAANKRYLT